MEKSRGGPSPQGGNPKGSLKQLQFGRLLTARDMSVCKSIESKPQHHRLEAHIATHFQCTALDVFFPFTVVNRRKSTTSTVLFKISIDIRSLSSVHFCSSDNSLAIVLSLPHPPRYYHYKDVGVISSQPWARTTDICETADFQMDYPVDLYGPPADVDHVDLGRWTSFRLVLDSNVAGGRDLVSSLRETLFSHSVRIEHCSDFKIDHSPKGSVWTYLDHPQAAVQSSALDLLNSAHVIHLDFQVRYQLEVCVSQGNLNEMRIMSDFLIRLAALDAQEARLRLEFLADQEQKNYNPDDIFEDIEATAYIPILRIPHYCTVVRKVTITPTTAIYHTPVVEASNRVLRKYNHLIDRFLRVQFAEEQESGRIGSCTKPGEDEIWKRVLRTLHRGIRIGERRYEFLAFGNSQLRQHGAYFFCPTPHVTCDSIREWMGDFKHIRVVAKHAARLGQCLSTSREIKGVYTPTRRDIPDIEFNGYCFSDGVGMISQFLAEVINDEMVLDVFCQPSAFQFRMGGCKGVLAVWPRIKGIDVCIRKSQEKFEAPFNGLEIVRCAQFSTATLNRQTIVILECLGVPQTSFLRLLDQQLHRFDEARTNNSTAIDLLTRLVDENQTSLILAEFLRAGFKTMDGLQELFVMNTFELWRVWSLKILKEKARIQVEKSAFVLGCVDETRSLRGHSAATEGSKVKDVNQLPQIFLQVSKPNNQSTIIRGVCIVGRNPALHPGDIRVVQAVDNPKLHHLKNVVVFPARGDRPVPQMLSGGDLDGDDFFVIWDETLVPMEWNHPPMNYTGAKAEELDREVGVNDLRNFFVDYMKNDALPLIATAHLGFADLLGPKSKKCLDLANLHSKAVDYPKTGEPAVFNVKSGPNRWAHFLQKKRNSYKSHKVLGTIFDKVSQQETDFVPSWENSFDPRILNRYPDMSAELLTSARAIKAQYDLTVKRVLAQHSLQTEFELWTTFAMTKPVMGSDYKRQEDLRREYDAVKQRFREMCYESAGGRAPEKLDPFVAAMYRVTEEESRIAAKEPSTATYHGMPLISFPWIFHWVLVRVALGDAYKPSKAMDVSVRNDQQASQQTSQPTRTARTTSLQGENRQQDIGEVALYRRRHDTSSGSSSKDQGSPGTSVTTDVAEGLMRKSDPIDDDGGDNDATQPLDGETDATSESVLTAAARLMALTRGTNEGDEGDLD